MTDTLKSSVVYSIWADNAALLGFSPISDNHGNVAMWRNLNCAGGASFDLDDHTLFALHMKIGKELGYAIKWDGVFPLAKGHESPLQAECRALNGFPKGKAPSHQR